MPVTRVLSTSICGAIMKAESGHCTCLVSEVGGIMILLITSKNTVGHDASTQRYTASDLTTSFNLA